MEIVLVRHGDANPKIEGTPLTKKGIFQAKAIVKELKNYENYKIYSSDLIRAKQTCEEFTKNYSEDKRIREIYRKLIGGAIKEKTNQNREINDKKRADDFLKEIIKNGENVLIFCHGNLIKYYLNKVWKSNENLWISKEIKNCSISKLEFKEGSLTIKETKTTKTL